MRNRNWNAKKVLCNYRNEQQMPWTRYSLQFKHTHTNTYAMRKKEIKTTKKSTRKITKICSLHRANVSLYMWPRNIERMEILKNTVAAMRHSLKKKRTKRSSKQKRRWRRLRHRMKFTKKGKANGRKIGSKKVAKFFPKHFRGCAMHIAESWNDGNAIVWRIRAYFFFRSGSLCLCVRWGKVSICAYACCKNALRGMKKIF